MYKVEIKLSDDEAYIEEVKKQFKSMSNANKLKTWHNLSTDFAPGPSDATVHILIQLPGESIDP